jgi:4-alpha-glucanotransferase
VLRIDHFRGFEAYWEIPASEPTAVKGRWVKGPGQPLFDALRAALGELPIVAEDLGVITAGVEACATTTACPA